MFLLGWQQPQFFGLTPHFLDRAGPTEESRYLCNGNLTQKTTDGITTTYVWDYANRLIALGVAEPTPNLKLTFHLDHSAGADHGSDLNELP
jgi:hypothetical protein